MPNNPRNMIRKATLDEEKLLAQEIAFRQGQLLKSVPKRFTITTKQGKCMEEIYEIFTRENLRQPNHSAYVQISEFYHIKKKYAISTFTRARKMLGVRYKKIRELRYYTFPIYAPTEALASMHEKYLKELSPVSEFRALRRRPSTIALEKIMAANNYIITNGYALHLMWEQGYSRSATLKAKSNLGIVNCKIKDTVYWLQVAQPVRDWYLGQLERDAISVRFLIELAETLKEWPEEMFALILIALPQIKYEYKNNEVYVYNSDIYNGLEHVDQDPDEPIISRIVENLSDRELIVDFKSYSSDDEKGDDDT